MTELENIKTIEIYEKAIVTGGAGFIGSYMSKN